MTKVRRRVSIIGPGVVGQALGRLLHERGYVVAVVAGRSLASARAAIEFIGGRARAARTAAAAARRADVVFITTPDRAVEGVCNAIADAGAWRRGCSVFHCSGALGTEALNAARTGGAFVGALHPIQTFPSPERAVRRMKGTWFTFDGDPPAREVAEEVVAALGGRIVANPPRDRVLYHAALCVLSNYCVALADLAEAMLRCAGMSREEAAKAAQPLLRGTVGNIASLGATRALTGPVARGDVSTVAAHLRALRDLPDEVRRLYAHLGLHTVRVARRKGTLTAPDARRIVRILQDAATA